MNDLRIKEMMENLRKVHRLSNSEGGTPETQKLNRETFKSYVEPFFFCHCINKYLDKRKSILIQSIFFLRQCHFTKHRFNIKSVSTSIHCSGFFKFHQRHRRHLLEMQKQYRW